MEIGKKTLKIYPRGVNYEGNVERMKERLSNTKHFSCIAEMYWECKLNMIHEGENIGQYISRMKKLIDLINAQFIGDKEVDFSDMVESREGGATMKLLINNAVGEQAVRCTEVGNVDANELNNGNRDTSLNL